MDEADKKSFLTHLIILVISTALYAWFFNWGLNHGNSAGWLLILVVVLVFTPLYSAIKLVNLVKKNKVVIGQYFWQSRIGLYLKNHLVAFTLLPIFTLFLIGWGSEIDGNFPRSVVFWGLLIAMIVSYKKRLDWQQAGDIIENSFKNMRIQKRFGILVRFLFYLTIGLWGYSRLSDSHVTEVPLSQLSISDIGGFLFGISLVLGSIIYFFRFPDDDEVYEMWGGFGFFLILIGVFAYFYFFSR